MGWVCYNCWWGMDGTKRIPDFHLSATHLKLEYECRETSTSSIMTNKIDLCSMSASAILGLALMYYKSFLFSHCYACSYGAFSVASQLKLAFSHWSTEYKCSNYKNNLHSTYTWAIEKGLELQPPPWFHVTFCCCILDIPIASRWPSNQWLVQLM